MAIFIGKSENGGAPDKYVIYFRENNKIQRLVAFVVPGTTDITNKIIKGLNISKYELINIILKEIGYLL